MSLFISARAGGRRVTVTFAVRRPYPWRDLLLMVGCILCIGGGIVFVSTPAAGGLVAGFGLLLMIGGSHE